MPLEVALDWDTGREVSWNWRACGGDLRLVPRSAGRERGVGVLRGVGSGGRARVGGRGVVLDVALDGLLARGAAAQVGGRLGEVVANGECAVVHRAVCVCVLGVLVKKKRGGLDGSMNLHVHGDWCRTRRPWSKRHARAPDHTRLCYYGLNR